MTKTKESIQFAIDTLTTEIVQLYAEEKSISHTEALKFFMSTDTYALLINPESYLFLESTGYVMDMLQSEIVGDIERWIEV